MSSDVSHNYSISETLEMYHHCLVALLTSCHSCECYHFLIVFFGRYGESFGLETHHVECWYFQELRIHVAYAVQEDQIHQMMDSCWYQDIQGLK